MKRFRFDPSMREIGGTYPVSLGDAETPSFGERVLLATDKGDTVEAWVEAVDGLAMRCRIDMDTWTYREDEEGRLAASILRKLIGQEEGYVDVHGAAVTVDCSWVPITKDESAYLEALIKEAAQADAGGPLAVLSGSTPEPSTPLFMPAPDAPSRMVSWVFNDNVTHELHTFPVVDNNGEELGRIGACRCGFQFGVATESQIDALWKSHMLLSAL